LEHIVTTLKTRKRSPQRLTRASKIFKAALRAVQEKKGEAVVSLDLRGIDEAVSDFFILCEASSATQIRAIADAVEDAIKTETGERPYRREDGAQWTLVDFVNIVVHILHPEQRRFYDLESLWADAGRMEHSDGAAS